MAENISQAVGTKSAVAVVAGDVQHELQRRRVTRIKRAIRRKTGGAISELTIALETDTLILRGHCTSFYHKQVAQHAAMDFLEGQSLLNDIEVAAKPR